MPAVAAELSAATNGNLARPRFRDSSLLRYALLLVINGDTVHHLSFHVQPSSSGGGRPAILGEHDDSALSQFSALHTGGDHRVRIDSRIAPRVSVGIGRQLMYLPIVDMLVDRLDCVP